MGPGFGYRAEGQLGEQNRSSGLLRYQGTYGIYEARYGRFGDQEAMTLSTSGGMVAIGNRIGIGAADVPLDYTIDTTEQIIAPPFRGGALVTFPMQHTQNFLGTLVVDASKKSVIPAYGQLTVMVEGKPAVSPLGKNGEFYLENLAAGKYPAKVEYKDGVCQFGLEIPVTDAPFVNLGTLHCVVP